MITTNRLQHLRGQGVQRGVPQDGPEGRGREKEGRKEGGYYSNINNNIQKSGV